MQKAKEKEKHAPILTQKEDGDRFGVVVEVLLEPFMDAYFLSLRQLRIMSGVTKAVKVWQESKLLLLWLSKMEDECAYEESDSTNLRRLSGCLARTVDVLHAVAIIRVVLSRLPLCSLKDGSTAIERDGVIYNLENLCSIRGSASNHTPSLLYTDLI